MIFLVNVFDISTPSFCTDSAFQAHDADNSTHSSGSIPRTFLGWAGARVDRSRVVVTVVTLFVRFRTNLNCVRPGHSTHHTPHLLSPPAQRYNSLKGPSIPQRVFSSPSVLHSFAANPSGTLTLRRRNASPIDAPPGGEAGHQTRLCPQLQLPSSCACRCRPFQDGHSAYPNS
jgi:hypothetical protein